MSKQIKTVENKANHGFNPLFYLFSGFLILVLPFIRLGSAQDTVLMPRLLALAVFLAIFIVFALFGKNKKLISFVVPKEPVFLLLVLYLLMVAVSMASASNPREGFFDLARTTVFIVMVFCWYQVFSASGDWFVKLPKIIAVSALLAAGIGYYQYFVHVAANPASRLPDGRDTLYAVEGLMAHKNLFSSYLMLMVPFLVFGLIKFRKSWRVLASAALVFVVVLIVLLGTRAVWVGTIVSIFFVLTMILFYKKKLEISNINTRYLAFSGLLFFIVIAALLLFGGRQQGNSYVKKLASIVRPSESNNHFRLSIWDITFDMVKEKPLTGVGAGNWQIIAPSHFNKIQLKGKEVNWQTPHNDFLWILSEKGFPGLLLFLSVFGFLFFYLCRILTGKAPKDVKLAALLLSSGVIAYLADSFFDFPYQRIDHQVFLSLFIAGILAIYHQSQASKPLIKNGAGVGAVLVLMLVCCSVYGYQAIQLEIHSKKAFILRSQGNPKEALAEINKAENPFRNIDAIGSPLDYYIGMIYSDLKDYKKSNFCFQKAFKQHPNHVALLNNLGLSYYQTGDCQQAEKYLLKALDIVPSYKESRINLATVYYSEKKYAEALGMLQGVKKKKTMPEIGQNIRALNKLLGYPEDSLVQEKKHELKKNKVKRNHKGKL